MSGWDGSFEPEEQVVVKPAPRAPYDKAVRRMEIVGFLIFIGGPVAAGLLIILHAHGVL